MDWFRLYAEMLDDPKIGTLNSDEFRLWIEVLCVACEAEKNGDTGLDYAGLAWRLRRDETDVKRLCNALETRDLFHCNGKTVKVTNWSKRQYASDTSTLRVRKHRETLQKRSSNGSVTVQSRDRADSEQNRTEKKPEPAPEVTRTVRPDGQSSNPPITDTSEKPVRPNPLFAHALGIELRMNPEWAAACLEFHNEWLKVPGAAKQSPKQTQEEAIRASIAVDRWPALIAHAKRWQQAYQKPGDNAIRCGPAGYIKNEFWTVEPPEDPQAAVDRRLRAKYDGVQ